MAGAWIERRRRTNALEAAIGAEPAPALAGKRPRGLHVPAAEGGIDARGAAVDIDAVDFAGCVEIAPNTADLAAVGEHAVGVDVAGIDEARGVVAQFGAFAQTHALLHAG